MWSTKFTIIIQGKRCLLNASNPMPESVEKQRKITIVSVTLGLWYITEKIEGTNNFVHQMVLEQEKWNLKSLTLKKKL